MAVDFDTIVVGAGIAGLMTAVRCAHAGERVAVLDARKIGAGATGNNHGIIHSGSVYSELHPELVPVCQDASSLFASHFPSAIITRNPTIHLLSRAAQSHHRARFQALGIACTDVLPDSAHAFFNDRLLDESALLIVDSLTVSSTRICASLAQMAVDTGVELLLHTPVHSLLLRDSKLHGVLASPSDAITAGRVILCSGSGIPGIFARSRLRGDRFRTRVDLMLTLPGAIDFPVVEYEFGGVYVVPTTGKRVLVSRFGGRQPFLDDARLRVDVPVTLCARLLAALERVFRPSAMHVSEATAYTCLKTELMRARADAWGVEPYHAVVNHGVTHGISNLWSLIPGKMTFAFHATRDLCTNLYGAPALLSLPAIGVEPSPSILAQTAPAPSDSVCASAWIDVR